MKLNENIWGGLPRKQCCDLFDEKDHDLILRWWNVATTISPIAKDVKRRQTNITTFEEHPTPYLQESQVLKKFPTLNLEICFYCVPCFYYSS
jgi:hypothetical protein